MSVVLICSDYAPLVAISTGVLWRRGTNVFGHSWRKAWPLINFCALAVDGQLPPVAFSPEASLIVRGPEATSTFHAGPAVKLIARTAQNRGAEKYLKACRVGGICLQPWTVYIKKKIKGCFFCLFCKTIYTGSGQVPGIDDQVPCLYK